MRHILYLNGQTFYHDSELPRCEYVVIGQRDEAHFKPDIDPVKIATGKLTNDEFEAVATFKGDAMNGKFAVKPLSWEATLEAAETAKASFPGPEWTNLKIVPVSIIIDNG